MTNLFIPPMMPTPSAALKDTASASADVRWVAAQALGCVDTDDPLHEQALAALNTLLSDPSPEVRAQAVEGLTVQAVGSAATNDAWIDRALVDSDAGVRCAAVDAALTLKSAPSKTLTKLLEDPDPSVRMAAAAAVGSLGDPASATALRSLYTDKDPAVRHEAALAATFLGDDSGEAILLSSLDNGTDDVAETILALGRIRSLASAEGLRKISTRFFGAEADKAAAALALFAVTDAKEGKDAFVRFLSARKSQTKIAALSALCLLPVAGWVEAVARLLDEKDEMVISSAIQTLVVLSRVDEKAAKALKSRQGTLLGAAASELKEAIEWLQSEQG